MALDLSNYDLQTQEMILRRNVNDTQLELTDTENYLRNNPGVNTKIYENNRQVLQNRLTQYTHDLAVFLFRKPEEQKREAMIEQSRTPETFTAITPTELSESKKELGVLSLLALGALGLVILT